jgi:hypothetical protein
VIVAAVVGGRAWVRSRDYLQSAADPHFRKEAVVPLRDGKRLSYGFSIRNDGPLSVKVTEVARPVAPGQSRFMFRPVAVRMAGRDGAATTADTAFRPFTLGKGHQRYVEVSGELGNCASYRRGSAEIIESQPVDFEVLGQQLTESVRLPTRYEIRYARC